AIRTAQETQKLLDVEMKLKTGLQLDWARLRDDIFGDAVVLAYRPGPPDKPNQDRDLLLIRARDAKLLADLFDRLNQAQKGSGDLVELEVRQYGGQKYYHRVERKEENYCWLHGPLLVLSTKEEMIRQAIDRDRQAGDGEPFVARQLRLLGADR